MRTMLMTLAFLFTVAVSTASGQSFIEIERDGGISIRGLLEVWEGDADGVPTGLFIYTAAPLGNKSSPEEPGPGFQVYGGFYASPIPWVKFYMGFGGERSTRKSPLRFGTSILLGGRENDRISSFTLYEDGGASGKWHQHETTFEFGPFNPGVFSQKLVGTGPFIEVILPYKFSITGGIGFGYGDANPIVSLRKIF